MESITYAMDSIAKKRPPRRQLSLGKNARSLCRLKTIDASSRSPERSELEVSTRSPQCSALEVSMCAA